MPFAHKTQAQLNGSKFPFLSPLFRTSAFSKAKPQPQEDVQEGTQLQGGLESCSGRGQESCSALWALSSTGVAHVPVAALRSAAELRVSDYKKLNKLSKSTTTRAPVMLIEKLTVKDA